MDISTVRVLTDLYAMTHPSTAAEVYETARDGGKIKEPTFIAIMLMGWMAASDYYAKQSSALSEQTN